MTWLAELLPLCFVRWYAQRCLERKRAGPRLFTRPRPGIQIDVET